MSRKPSPLIFHTAAHRARRAAVGLNPDAVYSTGWHTAGDLEDPEVMAEMDALFERAAARRRAAGDLFGQDRP